MTTAATSVAELWPPEAIEAIRAASLALLARAGVRVDSPAAADLLVEAGCLRGPLGRVLIPAPVVLAALESCPRAFTLLARDPARDLLMDPDPGPIYVHNMGEAPDVADARTGGSVAPPCATRSSRRASCITAATRTASTRSSPLRTCPPSFIRLYSYLAIHAETDKHVGGPGLDFPWQARYLAEMSAAAAGTRRPTRQRAAARRPQRPGAARLRPRHGLLSGEPAAPRAGRERRDRRGGPAGLAVQLLDNPVAGTTAPASIAGALAQQDAEVLAGVVLVQAAAPGAACSYGARLSAADPRTGTLSERRGPVGLASAGATLLARRHGLPATVTGRTHRPRCSTCRPVTSRRCPR